MITDLKICKTAFGEETPHILEINFRENPWDLELSK